MRGQKSKTRLIVLWGGRGEENQKRSEGSFNYLEWVLTAANLQIQLQTEKVVGDRPRNHRCRAQTSPRSLQVADNIYEGVGGGREIGRGREGGRERIR